MCEQTPKFIPPKVWLALKITAAALLALAILISAKVAITFCLGLFADGEHVVRLPGLGYPVVTLQELSKEEKKPQIPPDQLVELERVEIAVAGDVLLHMPIVTRSQALDGYNFDDIFLYAKPYLSSADYAVANLETTFAGLDGNEYTGSTNFNSPDDFVFSAKSSGFDMLLTGNDHCFDYGTDGLKRTLKVLRSNGVASLGTVENITDPRFVITELGGIKVGMASYTFINSDENGKLSLNGNKVDTASAEHINTFDYNHLNRFYTRLEGELAAMKAGGAEATVLFLHWGDEYSTTVTSKQKEIAQKLCDLGVDVIVGSHPHAVQPLDLLTSRVDHNHSTICMYSTGNFLSNLRTGSKTMKTGHCEDGVIFRFTLAKYNDESVRLASVKVIPTWVLVRGSGEVKDFYILPLDQTVTNWEKAYALSEEQLSDAKSSYNRTMTLVTSGLNKIVNFIYDQSNPHDMTVGVG